MKDWADFYPFVRPHVQGCPNPLLDQQLRLAAREFCEGSRVWKEWSDTVTADGTTNRFEFDIASGQDLVKVCRCLVNGKDWSIKASRDLPQDWETASTGLFETLVFLNDSEYMLFGAPASGDEIRLEIALEPALDGTGVDDAVHKAWADAIGFGAVARLLATPKKPWSEPGAAPYYRGLFTDAMHKASNQDLNRRGPMRVKVI